MASNPEPPEPLNSPERRSRGAIVPKLCGNAGGHHSQLLVAALVRPPSFHWATILYEKIAFSEEIDLYVKVKFQLW